MSRTVLIIDDEKSIRETLSAALKDEGYRVTTAASGREGIECLRSVKPEAVILDIWMPELDGLETLKLIKIEFPDQAVIMMSGHGTIETAVKATKLGAYDFLEKPPSLERVLLLLQNVFVAQDLARENVALRKQIRRQRNLIGKSEGMSHILDLVQRVAPTTGSALITGENGTGKELVAQSIHALSPRFSKPFVDINCAAIPEELIESELFGHERGAFTGATSLKRGKFDLANGGTIFLDEIGDMSLKTQAKILRILQEQKFERVGGTVSISVDVRVVAATNKDLKEEIRRGQFREDLYYRLNVIPFHIPPLRERTVDIPELVAHFMAEFSMGYGRKPRAFSEAAMTSLKAYSWPGNVRELKNIVERLLILTPDSEDGTEVPVELILRHLGVESVSPSAIGRHDEASKTPPTTSSLRSLRDARHEFERDFILKTLREQNWNVSKAAQVMGVERSHLHKKMKMFSIEHDPET